MKIVALDRLKVGFLPHKPKKFRCVCIANCGCEREFDDLSTCFDCAVICAGMELDGYCQVHNFYEPDGKCEFCEMARLSNRALATQH